MAGALFWMASASLLTVSTVVAQDNLPLSCTWLYTILNGCADDSFTFPDFTGWDLLKRHFHACLYLREDTTGSYECRQPQRFTTIVSCKMEAYLNAKEHLKQKDHEKGNQDFKACLSNTLAPYRGSNLTVAGSAEVEFATHGNYSQVLGHLGSKPNITIEYTHYL